MHAPQILKSGILQEINTSPEDAGDSPPTQTEEPLRMTVEQSRKALRRTLVCLQRLSKSLTTDADNQKCSKSYLEDVQHLFKYKAIFIHRMDHCTCMHSCGDITRTIIAFLMLTINCKIKFCLTWLHSLQFYIVLHVQDRKRSCLQITKTAFDHPDTLINFCWDTRRTEVIHR